MAPTDAKAMAGVGMYCGVVPAIGAVQLYNVGLTEVTSVYDDNS